MDLPPSKSNPSFLTASKARDYLVFHRNFLSFFVSLILTFATTLFDQFIMFLYLTLFSSDLFLHSSLYASFFLAIAFFTFSFHHQVSPPFFLAIKHAYKTASLKDLHKSVASVFINSLNRFSNLALFSFAFSFHTLFHIIQSFLTTYFIFFVSLLLC